jgi:ABC-type bacteriocin/lantibiotic exporter with double-glycine peptidase domain
MLSTIRRLLALLDRRDRLRLWLLVLVLILVALAETAGIAAIMPFMAVVTNPETIHSQRWLSIAYAGLGFRSDQSFLIVLGLVVLALLVMSNVIKASGTYLTLRYHNRLNYRLSRRLLARYLARPYQFFLKRNTAELGANVIGEVTRVVSGVLTPATTIVSSFLVCLAIIALLFLVDPLVALVIAGVLGAAYGAILLTARRKLSDVGKEHVKANHERHKVAAEAMSGIKDLKVLGREATLLRRFSVHADRHARHNVTAGLIAQLPRYALETIAFGGILLVVMYLVHRGERTTDIAPLLALYAFAGYRLMPALQHLFASITALRFNAPALDVLYHDLDADQSSDFDGMERLEQSLHADVLPFGRELSLRRVSFRYEDAAAPALRGLDIVIAPLTSVGIVGPTGCGKTTTVDIVLGLLAPSEGQFLVDGVEITQQNLAGWQKNLGYVPQHIYIADDTIARNIAFGVPDDDIAMDSVRHAARIANIADFIESELAHGYQTAVGERGLRLSGGQRQRIGIARALYRDPSVLVMDEATSALDGVTEEAVMEALHSLSRKKTIIVIAHRLSTVRECDVIYLMERGAIVAQGSYHDLMRESAWFRAAAGE